MKKILIIAVCMIFSSVSYAQVSIDKLEKDGSRVIISKYHQLYTKLTTAASFGLEYIEYPDGKSFYFLSLTLNEGQLTIDEGRKLLIKFNDDSTMELENSKKIGIADYEAGYKGSKLFSPKYIITEEQIHKIIDSNVVKIRIETDTDFKDRNISNNTLSKNLKKFYEGIKKAKSVPNNIYEGF